MLCPSCPGMRRGTTSIVWGRLLVLLEVRPLVATVRFSEKFVPRLCQSFGLSAGLAGLELPLATR